MAVPKAGTKNYHHSVGGKFEARGARVIYLAPHSSQGISCSEAEESCSLLSYRVYSYRGFEEKGRSLVLLKMMILGENVSSKMRIVCAAAHGLLKFKRNMIEIK